jgi:SAM-dependent methyltransferase
MMPGFDPATLAFYEKEAPVYTSSRPDGVARHLPDFLDLLPSGASILELGCGGGRDAEYMIARGFDVDPTDGVLSMATLATARLGCKVRLLRFDELDAFEQYDAVVATASLLHAPRDSLSAILSRVWRALKPGGLHVASFKGGGIEGRDEHGRYYNYPDENMLRELYVQSGAWTNVNIENYVGGGYFGKRGPWLKIIAKKAEIDNLAKSD